jgi:hypothetical protein
MAGGYGERGESVMARQSAQPRPRHTPPRVLGRLLIGKHWHGRALSDATFWRNGVEGTGEPGWWGRGRESWWALQAGWKRAALRLLAVATLAGIKWDGRVTLWVLALFGGPVLGVLLWRAIVAVRLWRHKRELVRPLSAALSPFLGVAPPVVQSGLSVRPDFEGTEGGEHVGALGLPDHWAATADQKARVEEIIGARFGIDLRYQWRTHVYPMVVNFTRAPVPPSLVPLAEVRAALAARPAHMVLLGRDADGSLHWWDRSSEDPHMAVHGGSRRGKTSLLLSLAAQEIERGGRVTAIDPKWVGLAALAGVPGVTLLNDPRDIHAMWGGIEGFHMMIEDRFEALSNDPTLEFDHELLIVDEVSMFSSITQRTWRAEKERSEPALAPVWGDLAASVWLGAQVHAHVVVAGQRLDYAILGGMLGSFGVRLLAGYGPQDYMRLVGVPPFLRSQKPRGRFLEYEGGDLTWLQLIYGEPGEWRDYALEPTHGGPDVGASVGDATSDVLIGLADGARYTGLTEAAFRKRRERGPGVPGEFRVGNQPAWHRSDLDRWVGHSVAGEAAKQ